MIFVALGSNLAGPAGIPHKTCEKAIEELQEEGLAILARSPWYRTRPVPASDQPDFINGIIQVESDLDPLSLLLLLHRIEEKHARIRTVPNAARTLDLDLIDWKGKIRGSDPILPHPRAHERAFVLLPLRDICPMWRHPTLGLGIDALIARLPPDQLAERLAE